MKSCGTQILPVDESPRALGAPEVGFTPVRGEVSVQILLGRAGLGAEHAGELLHGRVEAVVVILKRKKKEMRRDPEKI